MMAIISFLNRCGRKTTQSLSIQKRHLWKAKTRLRSAMNVQESYDPKRVSIFYFKRLVLRKKLGGDPGKTVVERACYLTTGCR